MLRLSVSGLSKAFDDRVILTDISFDLSEGESFCIIGGSGTGKSVLIKCILGLLKPDKGDIYIDGRNIKTLSRSERVKIFSRISVLFQGSALFDSMTVLDNVSLGLIEGLKMDPKQAHKIALEKLEAVDLSQNVASIYPAELSGGMQKRVALARAIATNPKIIFFDEPTTGLDPIVSSTINDLIVRCVKDLGASAISITHDIGSLRKIADRVGLLFKGGFVWIGDIKDIDSSNNQYMDQFIYGKSTGPFTQTTKTT